MCLSSLCSRYPVMKWDSETFLKNKRISVFKKSGEKELGERNSKNGKVYG